MMSDTEHTDASLFSGEFYATVFNSAVDGIFVSDVKGFFITVNPRITELTGYSGSKLHNVRFQDIISFERHDPEPLRPESMNTDTVITKECLIRGLNDQVFPAEVSLRKIHDEHILGTIRDISERRKAEESLKVSEKQYRALVESQIDLVSRYRADTTLTFVNDAYCRFFGKKREELIGQSFMFMVAPEFREVVANETKALAADPDSLVIGEYLNYTQEGDERWIQWVVHSITDENDNVLELQAVGRDVTQLKQTQEALRQANIVVESSPAILFRWKPLEGWPVDYVSNNITQLGYTVEELIEGSTPFISLIHPGDRDYVFRKVKKHATGNSTHFQQEFRILTKDGDVRWVDDRTVIERDGNGNIMHFQGIIIDVTERKNAEEERKKLETQLTMAQRMESVGRLAGGVAHDFNNMLTAILGHAQIALLNASDSGPIHEDISIIEQCAIRSAEIVRQLLAFARKQTIAPRVLDLNSTVTGMRKMLHRLIGEDIEFSWKPGPDLWAVKIDPSQIDQLLANLCVNARDAIDGVGGITIKTANVILDEEYCAEHKEYHVGDYVMLSVKDDGCGMDAPTIDQIFEPFFTTKEVGKGTGLGLATVYGIVEQNNGFIIVESAPDTGTDIKLYFPRSLEKPDKNETTKSSIPGGEGETILLVEDEEEILQVAETMLVRLGYQVLSAGTPGEAIRFAESCGKKIALLLTDVVMPEMNGRDLNARIRQIHPEMKCLYMSGYAVDVIAHRNVIDEKINFLGKPFTMKSLAEEIRKVLSKR
jgi:two-component system, cell cycle sensor histidine kinase and response regulator CckA